MCIVKGAKLCLPKEGCDSIVPPYIATSLSEKLFLFENNSFIEINAKMVCFKNITNTIHYIEFCHESSPICSLDHGVDEIILQKSVVVQVTETGNYYSVIIIIIVCKVIIAITINNGQFTDSNIIPCLCMTL